MALKTRLMAALHQTRRLNERSNNSRCNFVAALLRTATQLPRVTMRRDETTRSFSTIDRSFRHARPETRDDALKRVVTSITNGPAACMTAQRSRSSAKDNVSSGNNDNRVSWNNYPVPPCLNGSFMHRRALGNRSPAIFPSSASERWRSDNLIRRANLLYLIK